MLWLKGFDSASFSVLAVSFQKYGSAFCTTSPSSSSTSRSTPCAAGCCGPKFSVKLRISAIALLRRWRRGQRRIVAMVVADHARHERARLDRDRLVDDPTLVRVVAHLDVAGQREVLAERVPDEAVVGQDPPQVRVAAEQDAEQVEGLALVPVRARPDLADRVDQRRLATLAVGAKPQAAVVLDRQQLVGDREAPPTVHRRLAGRRALDAAAEAGAGRALRLPLALDRKS